MEFLFLPIRITGLTPELLSRFSGTITVSPAGMGRGCKIPVNGVCGTGVDKRDSGKKKVVWQEGLNRKAKWNTVEINTVWLPLTCKFYRSNGCFIKDIHAYCIK